MGMGTAYMIAGISTTLFLTLWFYIAYKDLSKAKKALEHTKIQFLMHSELLMKQRGSPQEKDAQKITQTSELIYKRALLDYEAERNKPLNKFPAFVFGFAPETTIKV